MYYSHNNPTFVAAYSFGEAFGLEEQKERDQACAGDEKRVLQEHSSCLEACPSKAFGREWQGPGLG